MLSCFSWHPHLCCQRLHRVMPLSLVCRAFLTLLQYVSCLLSHIRVAGHCMTGMLCLPHLRQMAHTGREVKDAVGLPHEEAELLAGESF